MAISIDKMADEIVKALDEYKDVCQDALKNAVDQASKETVDQLKSTSPRRTGKYAKSWTSKKDTNYNGSGQYGKIVYNKDHYRLTHLLENGHRIVRKGKTYGHVKAYPHIASAEQNAENIVMERLKRSL